jgi:hypothetical protein
VCIGAPKPHEEALLDLGLVCGALIGILKLTKTHEQAVICRPQA